MATDETLAWEAPRRLRAAAAAAGAAILIVGSFVIAGTIFADAPRAAVLDSLSRAAQPGPVGATESLTVPLRRLVADNAAGIIGSAAVQALGYLLLGFALTFLAMATLARQEAKSKMVQYAPIVGAVLSALAVLLAAVAQVNGANQLLDGPRTVEAAIDTTTGSLGTTAQAMGLFGGLSLAIGYALVSLNAMRVGLLTRFMGVLGMLAAALTIIPAGSPIPVVQCVWLLALAVLLAGRWPNGEPPAWRTGRAEPWPTQQELREQREAGGGGGGGARAGKQRPAKEPVTVPAGGEAPRTTPHPSSRKKKRKRRS